MQYIDDDLEAELGATVPTEEQLGSLEQQVQRAVDLMRQIEEIEAFLSDQKSQLYKLVSVTIPDALAAAGVSEFKTEDGVKIKIEERVHGSLPKDPDKRADAIAWLEAHDAADIIKVQVAAAFARGEVERADACRSTLRQLGIEFTDKEDVHASTLAAFARERLRAGEQVPLELLGLYAGRMAKIDLGKGTSKRGGKDG